jgi:hypothetical protein
MSPQGDDPECHFLASGLAAIFNFPLWRASAIAQSGFKLEGSNVFTKYYKAMQPPYKGVTATMLGMTWARGAIFYCSDKGRQYLTDAGVSAVFAQTVPPLVTSTLVQIVNMPLVRSTITIQDPACKISTVTGAIRHIYETKGFLSLWHGVSAGIMKTVPKYVTAIVVRDFMEEKLPKVDPHDKDGRLLRSAVKSSIAGLAGAALTNPLDVLRNEMFKTDASLLSTYRSLMESHGWKFIFRGINQNMVAVSIPIALTIFLTDILVGIKHDRNL